MAHMIYETTGRAAVMVAGKAAWHRLGVVVAEAQTSAEAIGLAGLDWAVNKVQMEIPGRDGGFVPVPGHFATVRSDTGGILGAVKGNYEPFQNAEAFGFMDELLGKEVTRYETAGALKDGKVVWMLARLPAEIKADGIKDVVEPYVLLTNSHDGTESLQIRPTTVRVVCNNTLSLALRMGNKRRVSFRMLHTKNIRKRVDEARKALGLIGPRVEEFAQEVQVLAKAGLSDAQARDYFCRVFKLRGEQEKVGGSVLDTILDRHEANREVVAGLLAADEEFTARKRENERRLLEQLVALAKSPARNSEQPLCWR